jgi:glycine/D-amino acid oxidase-like deaminating enzyme
MPDIGIIGGGVDGSHLGLFLRQHGVSATIYSAKTPAQHLAARITPRSLLAHCVAAGTHRGDQEAFDRRDAVSDTARAGRRRRAGECLSCRVMKISSARVADRAALFSRRALMGGENTSVRRGPFQPRSRPPKRPASVPSGWQRHNALVEKTARAIVAATINPYVVPSAAGARPYRSLQDRKEDR